jgi:hypothetical protein
MWFAIMHSDDKVIATGNTFRECREEADETKIWDMAPGTCAPYIFTTIVPVECSFCNGSGKVRCFVEEWKCHHCEGTGFSINRKGAPQNIKGGAAEQATNSGSAKQ